MLVSSNTLSQDWFYPILIGSVGLHILFIIYTNMTIPRSDFSVKQAPNTISISVLKSISKKRPVDLPIAEKIEEIVEKPIVEELNVVVTQAEIINKIIVPEPILKKKVEHVEEAIKEIFEETEPIVEMKQIVKETVVSEESLGAVTEAKPLGYINPAPSYPSIAKRRGWEGTVWLKVWVNARGYVDKVEIEESSGYSSLDRSAVKTVDQWQFKPAERNRVKISSQLIVPIEFKLINS